MFEVAATVIAAVMGIVAVSLSTTSLRRARAMQRKADEQTMALLDDLTALGELSRNVLVQKGSSESPSASDAKGEAAVHSRGKLFGPYSINDEIRAWTITTNDVVLSTALRSATMRSSRQRDAMLHDLLEQWTSLEQARTSGWAAQPHPAVGLGAPGRNVHSLAKKRTSRREDPSGALMTA